MSPSNDHERELARIVDVIAREGRLILSTVYAEVLDAVSFELTSKDNEFLMNYVKWRIANPIDE